MISLLNSNFKQVPLINGCANEDFGRKGDTMAEASKIQQAQEYLRLIP